MMEQYFEYKMWTDFFIPAAFIALCLIVFIIVGIYNIFIWLRDKRNGRK